MKIAQLRYALAVAREKNFSRAARSCNISQPSLSVAVRLLEEELGTPLFERFKSEIKITKGGEQILNQAHKALEEIERIKNIADSNLDAMHGSFRFGAIYSVGPYLFPTLVPAFHALAPKLTQLVEENFTVTLSERLKRGDVDAIIVALPFDEPGIEVRPLYDEPFYAAVPAGHPWQGRDDLHGDELANEKLLLLGEGHCLRDQILELCAACHHLEDTAHGIHNIIEGNSLETIRHMVAVGTGVTVMPATSIHNFICAAWSNCPVEREQMLAYVPFAEPAPYRRIALAWRQSYPNTQIIELLTQAIINTPPKGSRPILT